MKPDDADPDEALFSSFINSTHHDMPPPDTDFLAGLRERSTQAFLEAAARRSAAEPTPAPVAPHSRKRTMLPFVLKSVSACVAAALVAAAGFWSFFTPHQPALAFGEVLDRLAGSRSLHLEVVREGKAGEVWYAAPDRLRWTAADGTYSIARANMLWRIDEAENRATAEPAAFFREAADGRGLDVLALLDLNDRETREAIARRAPTDVVKRAGRTLYHYRVALAGAARGAVLEAFVDRQTRVVDSIEILDEKPGQSKRIASLNVLAVDAPVAEEKFVVRDTLTEDGRIGKIVDLQGLVSVKPVMHERWTAVCGKMLLKPGDWVRTDNRGANAATLKIVKQSQLILGPGSLVEVVSPTQVRIHSGEFEVTVGAKDALELVGPGDERVAVEGTQMFRVRNEKLARLEHEPKWLKGFKGTESAESIGSLIAKVDGRSVPLTVGYHKVTVDIRDQIARTVIEESFVNHTAGQLEGVFYFPLPDDASISGFGMWIGNELVEADIVEKQRAREIYETILREKRDPGLLEWTGGNIFKARVFPIFAHSEKRIKISYTQVLPARGSSYRYSYALQSELLKLHPLRELSIDLKLHSAPPLKNISSPTHTVRTDKTAHAAHVEFSAQDYTPTRDFEVVVDTDGKQADVVFIPHRRGDDGYFMLQLTPPASGDWQREVLPDGQPLQLLILADTSASMDAGQRRRQEEVVAALLAALTPRDTVNLAGCDVECDWVFEAPVSAEPNKVAAIRTFLEKRQSLGWTDLDSAFASAFKQAGAKTHIVYVGDGIVTTGDARPEGFAKRVKLAHREAGTTCHAVAVGSSFEPAVLKAIASLGSGSLRRVTGEDRPQMVATALLREMAQPGLRDLKIDFRGFAAARVYPEELANIPVGSQQILLGLYRPKQPVDEGKARLTPSGKRANLPDSDSAGASPSQQQAGKGGKAAAGVSGESLTGANQAGEVLVTGTQDGKPVKFSAKVSFKDAEEGNSFIPRLWAKMHLDSLLAQGASQSIRDEIIALSEEFQIMTPYTSFLVLESDADRARFKVKRRFRIRDGEKYFQEGHDNVNFELVQKQMQKAGNWRLGLRRMALARLATLGRDPRLFASVNDLHPSRGLSRGPSGGPTGRPTDFYGITSEGRSAGGVAGNLFGDFDGDGLDRFAFASKPQGHFARGPEPAALERSPFSEDDQAEKRESQLEDAGDVLEAGQPAEPSDEPPALGDEGDRKDSKRAGASALRKKALLRDFESSPDFDGELFDRLSSPGGWGFPGLQTMSDLGLRAEAGQMTDSRGWFAGGLVAMGRRVHWYQPDYVSWVNTLFPPLPAPESRKKAKPLKITWPDAARDLSQSLLRTEALSHLAGGLEIRREAQGYEARWNELTSRQTRLDLYSAAKWLTRAEADSAQTIVNWADAAERGVMGLAFGLGRVRKSTANDLSPRALDRAENGSPALNDYSLAPLHETYRDYTPTIERQDEIRTLLILKLPRMPNDETRIVIDTVRHVILSIEQRHDAKPSSLTKFEDFVEVAGSWWARRIETSDETGRRTALVTQTVQPATDEVFANRIRAELVRRDQVQLLHLPMPTVLEAKRAQAQLGKATFDSQLVLLLHFAQSQQWQKVLEQLEKCETFAAGKPGVRWVRNSVLSIARRHEELKGRLIEEAKAAKAGDWRIEGKGPRDREAATGDDFFLAEYVLGQASSLLEASELMRLLERLKPVYEQQPPYRRALKVWKERHVNALQAAGQPDAALLEQKQIAEENPRDYNAQQRYAQMLFSDSDFDAAYDWLATALASDADWHAYEEDSLRGLFASFLQQQGRYADLARFLEKWITQSPENSSVYLQFLSALVQADRAEQAEALIAQWLKEGTEAKAIESGGPALAVLARLSAAVSLALGQGYNLYTDRVEEKWQAPLAKVVLAAIRGKSSLFPAANQIMGHWRFASTDECRRVRKEIARLLVADGEKLSPEHLNQLIAWIMPNDPAVEEATWRGIAKALQTRWSDEKDPELKHRLAQTLVQALHRIGTSELLAFLRLQLAEGPEQYRAAYANQLFDTLLSQVWSAPIEDEAFALLERLSDAEEPAARLAAQVYGFYRLTDAMVNARNQAGLSEIEHLEQMPRLVRRAKTEEQLQRARQGFSDRLKLELTRHEGRLVEWLTIERLYLDTQSQRDLGSVATECFETLQKLDRLPTLAVPRPAATDDPESADSNEELTRRLDLALRSRYIATLSYLATRNDAEARLVDRLLKYVDQHLTDEPDNSSWKSLKFQLLVALDRPKVLKEALVEWMKADDADSRWRLTLGYLLAETGSVPEAIALFEGVAVSDELGPAAYAVLAGWYQAANRRDDYERARIRVYQTLEEWQMNQWLYQKLSPWQRTDGHLPSELDSEVLLMFSALFQKSMQPQNYLGTLQQFYQATHDFRLLAVLADSVVGHTAGKVYPFIGGMRGVLNEIRDEATADALKGEIAKVRERGKTAVDRRALDLVEAEVERRAAEVKNQPGPHTAAALAALERACEHEWSEGEQKLMADFLAGLGSISSKPLADEQLRQLRALYDAQTAETYDRLHVAQRLAEALAYYGRAADASDLLQAALGDFSRANRGLLPVSANSALSTLVSFLSGQRHFARAEKIVAEQLAHPVHGQQRLWLVQKLYEVYHDALRNDGEVSLGSGKTLYKAFERALFEALATTDQNHRYNLVNELCGVYRTAHAKTFPGVGEDLTRFAAEVLPGVLQRQTSNYTALVNVVAATLHDIVGVRAGLAFLIKCIEHEPGWFRYSNQDGWSQFAYTLDTWRFELKNLGDLDGRLLKIVLAELRRDLETQSQRNRVIYFGYGNQRFWKEKADDFARTADEVYARRKDSGAAVQYIADYLLHGLGRRGRAIEILFVANREKVLDERGRSQLVDFLHLEKRFGESIALLEPLVEEHPDNFNYRVWLMHAYFRTNRKADLVALLKQSDEFFHQNNRWNEQILAGLAASCLQNHLFEQCVKYYDELIPLHQNSQPNRGVGNGILSGYYANQALAYAGLAQTAKAVDAACGAIISWGPTHANRTNAIEALKNVLRQSADLGAYAAELDRQTEAENEDRPIVRKALGQVLLEKGQFPRAIAQLQRAVALEPSDVETHQALIACYDKINDREGAIRQILHSLELTRRDIAIYQNLGQRYTALERPREAERAYTSIVEALAAESESHALLAEIRQQQNRWPEAMAQWALVARIRALEPTGLLRLAGAQIHEKQWEAARESLRQLDSTTWPARFGDVHSQVRQMETQIKSAR